MMVKVIVVDYARKSEFADEILALETAQKVLESVTIVDVSSALNVVKSRLFDIYMALLARV